MNKTERKSLHALLYSNGDGKRKKFINKLKVFERLYEMVTGAKEKMKLRMI